MNLSLGEFKTNKRLWGLLALLLVLVITIIGLKIYTTDSQKKWTQAKDYYQKADYTHASEILVKMPVPSDPEELKIYGQTMFATNHLDKATTAYEKLYSANQDPNAKLMLGNIANQTKDFAKAEKIYLELIDANPGMVQTYLNLAAMYQMQGNKTKAIDILKKGTTNNSGAVTLYEMIMSVTFDDQKSADFQAAYAKVKELNPNSALLAQVKK